MCSSARDCIFGTTIVSSVTLILGDLWIINFHIHWIYLLACSVAMHHSSVFRTLVESESSEQQKASSPGVFYWEENEKRENGSTRSKYVKKPPLYMSLESSVKRQLPFEARHLFCILCLGGCVISNLFKKSEVLKVKMRLMELISFNHRALHFMRLSLCITKHEKAKRKVVRCVIWISARIFDDDSMQIEGKNSRRTARG